MTDSRLSQMNQCILSRASGNQNVNGSLEFILKASTESVDSRLNSSSNSIHLFVNFIDFFGAWNDDSTVGGSPKQFWPKVSSD